MKFNKIVGTVHAIQNIDEAKRLLHSALYPMGKAGFTDEELKPDNSALNLIIEKLTDLRESLILEIYK